MFIPAVPRAGGEAKSDLDRTATSRQRSRLSTTSMTVYLLSRLLRSARRRFDHAWQNHNAASRPHTLSRTRMGAAGSVERATDVAKPSQAALTRWVGGLNAILFPQAI